MLKIKDEVDLKELEKFGFEHWKYVYAYHLSDKNILHDERVDYYVTKNRELQVSTYTGGDFTLDDVIYDLIQANLVEKVEE